MDLELIFSLSNSLAFFSWILLIIFPSSTLIKRFLISVVVVLLAVTYVYLIVRSFEPASFESFNSLEGISSLFSSKMALLAGWIHYLAFDLMVGMYISKDAVKNNINKWILLPCLLFTFMLGPAGLLLYLLVRTVRTKRYFHDHS